jgi:hypothetical protein
MGRSMARVPRVVAANPRFDVGGGPRWSAVLVIGLLCGLMLGCDGYPRDPAGTMQRVRRTGVVEVGCPGTRVEPQCPEIAARIAAAAGAKLHASTASFEDQLTRLEDGELDLVVGKFADDSPWATRIHLLGESAEATGTSVRIAARQGENAWILLLERAYRQ